MSASRTGWPRGMRASRSMTRTAVNGSPDSATAGGAMFGSGRPAGAGRSGPSPTDGIGRSDTGASVTRRGSPTGSLGIRARSLSRGHRRCQPPRAHERTFIVPTPHAHRLASCLSRRATAPVPFRACGRSSSLPREPCCLRPTPPRPRPTRPPRCRAAPPPAAPLQPIPSPAAPAPTTGRTPAVDPPLGARDRPGRDVRRRHRRRTRRARIGLGDAGASASGGTSAQEFDLITPGMGHAPQGVRRPGGPRRPDPRLRGHQRPDRGRRRHRPYLVPDARGAGGTERRAVRVVRRDRHPDRRDRRRSAARRRRLPEQPGGGSRHPGRGHHRERRRPVDHRPRPRRRRQAGSAARPGPRSS